MDKKEKELKERLEKLSKLKKAAEPLIKLMCEEYHPHVTAIVTPTQVEILEGVCCVHGITDFIVD